MKLIKITKKKITSIHNLTYISVKCINFETFKLGVDNIWFNKHIFIIFEAFIILSIILIPNRMMKIGEKSHNITNSMLFEDLLIATLPKQHWF